ncbi:hypothetical protein EPN90_05010 [Patescibacteria group bacterium]|nr:MAG: hypothetical protein EPN90_05010 [Patescibacteria group bacterium]
MKITIGLVGAPAAGKGTIAAYLEKTRGAKKFRFSDPLFDILVRLGIVSTRDNMIKLSEILRATFGETLLAEALLADAQRCDAELIVVDGVRREGDVAALRRLPGFHLAAISTQPELRFERSKIRAEKSGEATQSYKEFLALEQRSTETSARELEKTAEVTFDNNNGLDNLYRQIDEFVMRIS